MANPSPTTAAYHLLTCVSRSRLSALATILITLELRQLFCVIVILGRYSDRVALSGCARAFVLVLEIAKGTRRSFLPKSNCGHCVSFRSVTTKVVFRTQ